MAPHFYAIRIVPAGAALRPIPAQPSRTLSAHRLTALRPSAQTDRRNPAGHAARDLRVVNGANLGDPLSFAAELDAG